MANVLFTNVRILDGTGAAPYPGEVLVQGNRISRVGRGARALPASGVTTVDGGGATLMPGLVEAHTHFSWNDQPSLNAIQRMPTEEHILWCAHIARRYLDMGWTSCIGAATAKPRLDVVIRNAIESGQIAGPRYLAASQEITVPGGLGDETLPHLPFPEFSFGAIVNGPEEMRKTVRMFLKYGVDTIKLNLSGEYIAGMPAEFTPMTDEEIAVAVKEAHVRGKRVSAHARSAEAVKQCVRHGDRDHLPRQLRRRGSPRHAGGQEGPPLRGARPGLAHQHLLPRRRVGHPAGGGPGHGLPSRARGRLRDAQEDAPARHPRAARRRLRLRLDQARHQREGSGVLRDLPGLHADGGAVRGHPYGGADHAPRPRARAGQGGLPRRPAAGRRRPARQPRHAAGSRAPARRS